MSELQVVKLRLDELVLNDQNPRKTKRLSVLKNSLDRYGFVNPVIGYRSEDGRVHVVSGHHRIKAAKERGIEEVPVIVYPFANQREANAFGVMDNRSNDLVSEWDFDLLRQTIDDFRLELPEFDPSIIGWNESELQKFFYRTKDQSQDVHEENRLRVNRKLVSKVGDLWCLGTHRLVCGDSTDPATVDRLMDGRKASLLSTDPPYGIDYRSVRHMAPIKNMGIIQNDQLTTEQLKQLIGGSVGLFLKHAVPNPSLYVWVPNGNMKSAFWDGLTELGILIHREIIWAKSHLCTSVQRMYHYKHESCFFGWRTGKKPAWYGGNKETTLWEVANNSNGKIHPTQKPVELYAKTMLNSTQIGDVVYEPFSGSGSAIIASEELGRVCCAVELDPFYVDESIRRYQSETGTLVRREDGRLFDEVAE